MSVVLDVRRCSLFEGVRYLKVSFHIGVLFIGVDCFSEVCVSFRSILSDIHH